MDRLFRLNKYFKKLAEINSSITKTSPMAKLQLIIEINRRTASSEQRTHNVLRYFRILAKCAKLFIALNVIST